MLPAPLPDYLEGWEGGDVNPNSLESLVIEVLEVLDFLESIEVLTRWLQNTFSSKLGLEDFAHTEYTYVHAL